MAKPSDLQGKLAEIPTQLLAQSGNPYALTISIDEEAIYLASDDGAVRIAAGQGPVEIAPKNAAAVRLTQHYLIYWSEGAVWRVPKTGGKRLKSGDLPHRPQYFVSAEDRLVWLDEPRAEHRAIMTFQGTTARSLYETNATIDALAMTTETVFFVERTEPRMWRMGSVSASGGATKFSAMHAGAPPAMLAVARDVFFFDIDTIQIRKVSADLAQEETVLADFVCTPLAVSSWLYCANPDGLYQVPLSLKPAARPVLLHKPGRTIAAISADSKRIVWLTDRGREQFSMDMLPVAPASEAHMQ